MTRAEHLAWCKQRALAELDNNSDGHGADRAFASMTSDLRKHPDTAATGGMPVPVAVELAFREAISGTGMRTADEVRRWIEGFT